MGETKTKCACVRLDAKECIHIRTHPPQIDDAFDFPCRDCTEFGGDECECPCHWDDEDWEPYGWEAEH